MSKSQMKTTFPYNNTYPNKRSSLNSSHKKHKLLIYTLDAFVRLVCATIYGIGLLV